MPTDKDAAAAYRLLAEYHQAEHEAAIPGAKSSQAQRFTERADALDPPRPTYADGLYRSARHGRYWELRDCTWHGTATSRWTYPASQVDRLIAVHGELTPVRVLADDEIAIKNPGHLASHASGVLRSAGCGTSAELLGHIRAAFDALDAEAQQ